MVNKKAMAAMRQDCLNFEQTADTITDLTAFSCRFPRQNQLARALLPVWHEGRTGCAAGEACRGRR
jgi:hypothetical protein